MDLTTNQDIKANLLLKQMNLERRSKRLAEKLSEFRSAHVKSHALKQLKSFCDFSTADLAKTVPSLDALLSGRWSRSEYESKIDRLLQSKSFDPKTSFSCSALQQATPRFLADSLSKYAAIIAPRGGVRCLLGRAGCSADSDAKQIVASVEFERVLRTQRIDQRRLSLRVDCLRLCALKVGRSEDATDSDCGSDDERPISGKRLAIEAQANCCQTETSLNSQQVASFRWNRKRARVGSKLWLLKTQVAQLDSRILQYASIYRKIRLMKTKGNADFVGHSKNVDSVDGTCARTIPYDSNRIRSRLITSCSSSGSGKGKNVTCGDCCPPFGPCIPCGYSMHHGIDSKTADHRYSQNTESKKRLSDSLEHDWLRGIMQTKNFVDGALQQLQTPKESEIRAQASKPKPISNGESSGEIETTARKWSKYVQAYRKDWEKISELKEWLMIDASNPRKAKCRYCADANLNAHLRTLKDHAASKTHKTAVIQGVQSDTTKKTKKTLKRLTPLSSKQPKCVRPLKRRRSDDADWTASATDGDDSDGSSLTTSMRTKRVRSPAATTSDSDWSPSPPPPSKTIAASKRRRQSLAARLGGGKASKLALRRATTGGATGVAPAAVTAAYDIDNIVIDRSIIASQRIEVLQYKEIATPGWRLKEYSEMPAGSANISADDQGDLEDISDESYLRRHDYREFSEHKRLNDSKRLEAAKKKSKRQHSDAVTVASPAIDARDDVSLVPKKSPESVVLLD